ncbi:MAG: deoxyhypusine synthase [Candidatus Bathyarchaeia archaeon]
MAGKGLLQVPVRDMKLTEGMNADELIAEMGAAGGFSARAVARGVDILERILTDEAYTVFLSFPACVMATGLRGALTGLVKRGLVDVIVTTGGTLDHDLSRAWGGTYYEGSFQADDVELHRVGIHRLGNIFIPMREHGPLIESRLQPLLAELQQGKHSYSVRELCEELGRRIESPDSLLRTAYERRVPIYSLGVLDSAFGSQLFMFAQTHEFQLDFWKDMRELIDMVFDAEKTGALIIGGGISKHTVIWYNQYRDGLDSAVFLTTAVEYDGSLSGARLREAISWGKVRENADEVTVEGEATVLLPLMLLAVYERIARRKRGGP